MRTHDINVGFHIFRLLKVARFFDKNLGYDTYEVKFLTQDFARGLFWAWSVKHMLVFVFYETFK